jgi:hypothetical protein
MAIINAIDGRPRVAGLCALYRLDLKEPGYKVAWIEKPSQVTI